MIHLLKFSYQISMLRKINQTEKTHLSRMIFCKSYKYKKLNDKYHSPLLIQKQKKPPKLEALTIFNKRIFYFGSYPHFKRIDPQVNPAPKADKIILSPFRNLFSHSHKHNGIVAEVVFPYR